MTNTKESLGTRILNGISWIAWSMTTPIGLTVVLIVLTIIMSTDWYHNQIRQAIDGFFEAARLKPR